MLPEFVVFLIIGALAGYLAGLLGIGGGLVIVPALALWLGGIGYAMHLAVATSLATIVLTSVSSLVAHHRHGAVRWPLVLALSPGLVLGALGGAGLASALSGPALGLVFGGFCGVVGVRMWVGASAPPAGVEPGRGELLVAGTGIGVVSAIVGIGGGTLTVPYLSRRGVDIHRAVATSAACGLPIALAGMAGFMVLGADRAGLPSGALGFVWLPAVLGIGLASVATAPLGAMTAHRVGQRALKRVFGSFLVVLGVYFVLQQLL